MRWKEIPQPARRYMIYHMIISPTIFVWYALPAYMLITGFSPLEIGILFSIINAAAIPTTYLIGKYFNNIPIKKGLIAIKMLPNNQTIKVADFIHIVQEAFTSLPS